MRPLTLDIPRRRIAVGRKPLPLTPLEQAYYRYFAERVVKGLGPAAVDGSAGPPADFADAIARFLLEAFPERPGGSWPRTRFTIGAFRTAISRINAKVGKALGSAGGPEFRIRIDGARNARRYSLGLARSRIRVITSTVGKAYAREVRVFSPREALTEVLRDLRDRNYTQAVVRVDSRLRLLTVEGIARWLAALPRSRPPRPAEVSIGEVLGYERTDNVYFISADDDILDARTYFSDRLDSKRPNLVALVITPHGRSTEDPIGIITPADFLDRRHW